MKVVQVIKKPVHYFQSKLIDWFLYDTDLHRERIKDQCLIVNSVFPFYTPENTRKPLVVFWKFCERTTCMILSFYKRQNILAFL